MEFINKVKEFRDQFLLNYSDEPNLLEKDAADLHVKLLREEVDELETAFRNRDLIEVADALTDILYVLGGAIAESGLADKMPRLFDEVHRSNLSKVCQDETEAAETVKKYFDLGFEKVKKIKTSDGKYLIKRLPDNKVLKNKYWSTPDLESIVYDNLH